MNEALDEWFPEENDVIVIAEPGRYFAASSFTLATKINSIKKCSNDGHIMYFINDGVYGSFNNVLYDGSTIIPRPLKVSYIILYYLLFDIIIINMIHINCYRIIQHAQFSKVLFGDLFVMVKIK